ncbi:MAG: hypothetical protein ACQXXL_05810 [Candidatus Methanosuratincola sp.]|jgi:hypothetical protein|nr:hypothetical protein [Candidatus Methanosuratincola sp.]
MRALDHVRKEGKLIPLSKGGERFFLKVFERDSGFSADLWVFDTYPGEGFKGIPIRLDQLSAMAPSFGKLIAGYRRMGFKVLHPYHKYPKWFKDNDLEEKISTLYREVQD